MMASSLVLLFSRSIEVGEKLGAGGSMLSHIFPLSFSHSSFLFLLSAFWRISVLLHLLIEKRQSLSFDTITCCTNLPISTSWRLTCFITTKDVQQLVRNSQADCLDLSDGGDGFHGAGTLRSPRSPREGEGRVGGDAGGEKLLKTDQMTNNHPV